MTDKTPKKKEKNLVNTQAASTKATDTARDSEPEPTAVPSADALKSRFKAGSIPLQTDFADMIDLANIGRQAVGGEEDQAGPADGFTLSSKGLLELNPNESKGISVDQYGVAVKVNKGIEVDQEGVAVKAGDGIEVNNSGVSIIVSNDQSGLSTDGDNGLSLNELAWIRTMCGLHSADFYGYGDEFAVFCCNMEGGSMAYIYGRNGKYVTDNKSVLTLSSYPPKRMMVIKEVGSDVQSPKMVTWAMPCAVGKNVRCEVKDFIENNPSATYPEVLLIKAP